MIKCPNCTAQLAFEVSDQKIKCDYCGSSFEPAELRASLNVADEKNIVEEKVVEEKKEEIEATSYNCDNCGAVLLVYDDTAVTFCNYCGSSNVIKSKLIKQTKPDYIIPFEIDKDKLAYEIKNYDLKQSDYIKIDMNEAIELADIIFDNEIDKLYFLRQYIKDGNDNNIDDFTKTIKFTK